MQLPAWCPTNLPTFCHRSHFPLCVPWSYPLCVIAATRFVSHEATCFVIAATLFVSHAATRFFSRSYPVCVSWSYLLCILRSCPLCVSCNCIYFQLPDKSLCWNHRRTCFLELWHELQRRQWVNECNTYSACCHWWCRYSHTYILVVQVTLYVLNFCSYCIVKINTSSFPEEIASVQRK